MFGFFYGFLLLNNLHLKRIILLSDTHSYMDDSILKHCAEADEIWHAGDFGNMDVIEQLQKLKPVRGVFGNIDGADIRKTFPRDVRFTCEGVDVWMIHIGGYPPRYEPHTINIIKQNPPDIFICGHSHILKIMRDPSNKKILHINPGAAGKHGFQTVRTLVKFTLHESQIADVEVVELGNK